MTEGKVKNVRQRYNRRKEKKWSATLQDPDGFVLKKAPSFSTGGIMKVRNLHDSLRSCCLDERHSWAPRRSSSWATSSSRFLRGNFPLSRSWKSTSGLTISVGETKEEGFQQRKEEDGKLAREGFDANPDVPGPCAIRKNSDQSSTVVETEQKPICATDSLPAILPAQVEEIHGTDEKPSIETEEKATLPGINPREHPYKPMQEHMHLLRRNKLTQSDTIVPYKFRKAKKTQKKVAFAKIEIREYEVILGDNPSTIGPPMALGWDWVINTDIPAKVDEYENSRGPRRQYKEIIISRLEREIRLRKLGYSKKELNLATKAAREAQRQRNQTVERLQRARADEFEEKTEDISRFMKTTFRRIMYKDNEEDNLWTKAQSKATLIVHRENTA